MTHRPRSDGKRYSEPFLTLLVLILVPMSALFSQTEPEAPRPPEIPRNGYQISFFSGVSYNVFSGQYDGGCPCEFVAEETSGNVPYGFALNIPLFFDAALYLRGGVQNTSTTFFMGRNDSLRSGTGTGNIGDELQLDYNLVHFDILLRLIGRQDGERVFVGPSFGFVRKKHVRLTETEYPTGAQYNLDDGDIEGGKSMRMSIIIGVEYAFVPLKNMYIIPSLQVDYTPQRISDVQLIRPTFYKFLVSVAYQIF